MRESNTCRPLCARRGFLSSIYFYFGFRFVCIELDWSLLVIRCIHLYSVWLYECHQIKFIVTNSLFIFIFIFCL